MIKCRFLFTLAVILTCLGTVFLGARISQAQDVTQETDIIKLQGQAEQGDALAQNDLGVMYDLGQGVSQDYTKAKEWYEKSASQGFVGAQFNLGLLYANGNGVPQDYVQAHKWLNLAAAQGNNDAAKNRDQLAKHVMTSEQIAEAQRLARKWKENRDSELNRLTDLAVQGMFEEEALKIQAQHPYVAEIDNLPPKFRDEVWAKITGEALASLAQKGINPADGKLDSRLALIREKAALTNRYGPQYTGKKVGLFDDLIPPSETAQNRVSGAAVNSKPATDPSPMSELSTLIFDEEESGTPNYIAVEKPDFTLTLPTEWQEISKEILAAIHKNLKRGATGKNIPKYDYGFQLGTPKDSIRYPYILIQKIEDGKISESQLKSLPKLDLNSMAYNLPSIISNVAMDQMNYYYDESARVVWMTGHMDVALIGRVLFVKGMIPTKNGFLAIHAYAKETNFESYLPVFQRIIASAKIAPALSYKPYVTDGLLAFDWDSIISKAIVGGLGGGIIAVFFGLGSMFFGVFGRKKRS